MRVSELTVFLNRFSNALPVVAMIPDAALTHRAAINHIGHHNPGPTIDDGTPVELFAIPWTEDQGTPMTVEEILTALVAFPQGADLRVALPVKAEEGVHDADHHRCLGIAGLGFGSDIASGELEIRTEGWDSIHKIIRID